MTEKEIRILLLLADVSQVSIANKLEIPRSAVHQVITGVRHNPRIRKAIAAAVGRPVEQLWPVRESPNNNDEQVKHHTKNSKRMQARK